MLLITSYLRFVLLAYKVLFFQSTTKQVMLSQKSISTPRLQKSKNGFGNGTVLYSICLSFDWRNFKTTRTKVYLYKWSQFNELTSEWRHLFKNPKIIPSCLFQTVQLQRFQDTTLVTSVLEWLFLSWSLFHIFLCLFQSQALALITNRDSRTPPQSPVSVRASPAPPLPPPPLPTISTPPSAAYPAHIAEDAKAGGKCWLLHTILNRTMHYNVWSASSW